MKTALVHGGGSRLGDSTVVCPLGDLTATGRHLVQKFLRHGRPGTLKAVVGSALSKGDAASALECRAYGRPYGRQENTGQGDENGLF